MSDSKVKVKFEIDGCHYGGTFNCDTTLAQKICDNANVKITINDGVLSGTLERISAKSDSYLSRLNAHVTAFLGLGNNNYTYFSEKIQGSGTFHGEFKTILDNRCNIKIIEGSDQKLVFVYPTSRYEDEIKRAEERFGNIAAIIFLEQKYSSQLKNLIPITYPKRTYPVFNIYYNGDTNSMHEIPHNKTALKSMKMLGSSTD
ncbi:uncharacterized protein LOC133361297 isoform X2 [Lethenteron reissneri]|uniref:uncharacterized protein LOC133361297 isoform X2 n=1 Tax=Lethenteron reissneri TaxID=7753 RepID=UPI002AB78E84|nr:uncharacterized protein LOC133361297 isoform X2 [Lethenteron reissneri]XP_061436224.1 uncharacterized protein LOC133361297 isoform X2 [Lethenteron reissneri]